MSALKPRTHRKDRSGRAATSRIPARSTKKLIEKRVTETKQPAVDDQAASLADEDGASVAAADQERNAATGSKPDQAVPRQTARREARSRAQRTVPRPIRRARQETLPVRVRRGRKRKNPRVQLWNFPRLHKPRPVRRRIGAWKRQRRNRRLHRRRMGRVNSNWVAVATETCRWACSNLSLWQRPGRHSVDQAIMACST